MMKFYNRTSGEWVTKFRTRGISLNCLQGHATWYSRERSQLKYFSTRYRWQIRTWEWMKTEEQNFLNTYWQIILNGWLPLFLLINHGFLSAYLLFWRLYLYFVFHLFLLKLLSFCVVLYSLPEGVIMGYSLYSFTLLQMTLSLNLWVNILIFLLF